MTEYGSWRITKNEVSKVCISLACTMYSLGFQTTAQSSHSLAACEGQGYSGKIFCQRRSWAELGGAKYHMR